jgi:CheY-like chemotaxis protein
MTHKKLMLVEDEALISMLLIRNMEFLGYQICGPYATGEAAIQGVIEDNPDIVLMDVHLAGSMDGLEATAQILNRRDIPFIFMTGYIDEAVKAKALALQPAAVYLVKPVTPDDIEAALLTISGNNL